jgi:hypothetical protein
VIRTLEELVAYPTFQVQGVENHNNHQFIRFEKRLVRWHVNLA